MGWVKLIGCGLLFFGLFGGETLQAEVIPRLVAGTSHSVALMADGTLQAWGDNALGQLGNDSTIASPLPVAVVELGGTVTQVAAGGSHTVALLADGTVKAWGNNAQGQLGDGTTTFRQKPVTVTGLVGTVVAVAAGTSHSAALMADGTVRMWGGNSYGQLGNGQTVSSSTPVTVINLNGTVVTLVVGGSHNLALMADGTLRTWGYNAQGQLGNGTYSNSSTPVMVTNVGGNVAVIAAGGFHSLVVLDNGTLKAWGRNTEGQLGNGATANSPIPVTVTSPGGTVSALVAGALHTVVLLADGTLKTWGGNSLSQLGNGTLVNSTTPLAVGGITGAVYIAAGGHHTLALLADGTVKAWGSNSAGQLGNGVTNNTPVPSAVMGLAPSAIAVAGGSSHSVALVAGGTVHTWGVNGSGQLGTGSVVSSPTPVAVATLDGTATAVGARDSYSVALLADGTVRTWGANVYGQLGTGSYSDSPTPVAVTNITGTVIAIAPGHNHMVALLADGSVMTWGNNGAGQLGTGGYVNSPVPVTVTGLGGTAVAVAAGYNFSVALLADGTVKAWGNNGSGQLGNGTYTASPLPVTVSNLGNVTAIAAGSSHTMAILGDGTVKAWGRNAEGQLGNGSTTKSPLPVTVSSLGAVATAIVAGDSHSVALLADGRVKAWGYNNSGQLGDGTFTQKTTPVQVPGLVGVIRIGAGDFHTLAITADGEALAWGANGQGQLGDGKGPVFPQAALLNLDNVPPVVTVDNPGGTYSDQVTVTLGCSDSYTGCNTLVYTDDGSVPSWPLSGTTKLYTAPLVVTATATITYFAVDRAGTKSAVTPQSYVITSSTYPLTITFAGTGRVELSSGTACSTGCSQPVTMDTTVTLAPRGGAGFYFGAWSGCDSQVGNVCSVVMSGPRTVAVSFTPYPAPAVVAVAAGTNHAVALLDDGILKAWGDNTQGQLGDGSTTSRLLPIGVLPLGGTVVAIAAGGGHTLALLADGSVRAWGSNSYGQLGDGTLSDRSTPVTVVDLGGPAIAITAGAAHSMALLADGTVRSWGNNGSGQLGDGSLTSSARPVVVTGLGGRVTAISAGTSHSLALLADGTIAAWGHNGSGQLGDGGTTNRQTPVTVQGLAGFPIAIAAGGAHSVALLADSTVRTWGANTVGQLGNGSTTDSPLPLTPVALGGGVVAVAAGAQHTMVLQSDGTVKTWGGNEYGELGNGSTVTRSLSPVTVSGLTGTVTAIAAGARTNFALNSQGVLRGWGGNGYGQLGNGGTANSNLPVDVNGVTVCNTKIGGVCFATISAAYAVAITGDTILAKGISFDEAMNANRSVSVSIRGGYASDFASRSGTTLVKGLTVTDGTLILDELTVQ